MKFGIGDIVVFGGGSVAKVTHCWVRSFGTDMYEVECIVDGSRYQLPESKITRYHTQSASAVTTQQPQAAAFNVGEEVEIVNPGTGFHGLRGRISPTGPGPGSYNVSLWMNGTQIIYNFLERQLKKVPQAPSAATQAFIVVGGGGGAGVSQVGHGAAGPAGNTFYYAMGSAPNNHGIEVGDRVTVTGSNLGPGTVSRVMATTAEVEFDDGTLGVFYSEFMVKEPKTLKTIKSTARFGCKCSTCGTDCPDAEVPATGVFNCYSCRTVYR